jgi:hypothetical protein
MGRASLRCGDSPLFVFCSGQVGLLFDKDEVAGHLFSCSGSNFLFTMLGPDND